MKNTIDKIDTNDHKQVTISIACRNNRDNRTSFVVCAINNILYIQNLNYDANYEKIVSPLTTYCMAKGLRCV